MILVKNQSINQSEYPEEVQFRENRNQIENDRIDRIDENLFDTYLQILKTNVQYDTLCHDLPYSKNTIDEMLLIVADTLCSKKPYLRISSEDKPADHVKGQLLKLSSDHIRYVDSCMDKTTTEIHNIRAYLLSTLKCPPCQDKFFENEV